MKLRVLAFALAILAFFLFVGSPFQQSANALVGVDDALIAVIIAALAAVGITFVTSAAYSASRGYVADLMTDYAIANNTTVRDQFRNVQIGSNSLGKLLTNNRFVVYIQGFAAYLIQRFGLIDNKVVHVVSPGTSINGVTAYTLPLSFSGYYDYEYEFTLVTSDVPVFAFSVYADDGSPYPTLYLFANQQAVVSRYSYNQYGNWTQEFVLARNTSWALPYVSYTNTDIGAGSGLIQVDYLDLLDAIGADKDVDINNIGTQIDIYTREINLPYDDSSYTEGDGAVIDVGADWGDSYWDITGDVIPDEFSDGNVGESTMTYEGDAAIENQVEDTPSQSISQEVEDYQVTGLSSVFPFCIPFDMYNFVSCLAAEPVAPSFIWRFYVPGICDETIVIDLSDFDQAAQILRTMELLLFCVGLAFVTRKMIRG